jgi:hypothetical protein
MTFIHPFFRRPISKWDEAYFEDETVKRVKRRIEVKWGICCILSLVVWIVAIVGIVVLILKTTKSVEDATTKLVSRWVAEPLRDSWKIFY